MNIKIIGKMLRTGDLFGLKPYKWIKESSLAEIFVSSDDLIAQLHNQGYEIKYTIIAIKNKEELCGQNLKKEF